MPIKHTPKDMTSSSLLPDLLYYNSPPEAILPTLATGLHPPAGQSIRLLTTPAQALMGTALSSLIVEVDAEEAASQGYLFRQVSESEWYTAGLAAQYLTLTPWHELTVAAQQQQYWQELQREVGPSHYLHQQLAQLKATWQHQACDELLFLNHQTERCYVVHLTWRGAQEIDGWPSYV
ncbi:MAG: hypothetical protein EOO63_15020, partial [Hymenobacter sp.]